MAIRIKKKRHRSSRSQTKKKKHASTPVAA
jgi:hypothetical protein